VFDCSWRMTVVGVDRDRVGSSIEVEQMIEEDSWVFGVGSLRTASTTCPDCQSLSDKEYVRKYASRG
jgi:hypothetical protein